MVGILVVTGAGVVVDCFVVGRLFLRFFVSNSDFSEIENLATSYNLICQIRISGKKASHVKKLNFRSFFLS